MSATATSYENIQFQETFLSKEIGLVFDEASLRDRGFPISLITLDFLDKFGDTFKSSLISGQSLTVARAISYYFIDRFEASFSNCEPVSVCHVFNFLKSRPELENVFFRCLARDGKVCYVNANWAGLGYYIDVLKLNPSSYINKGATIVF